ncbi:MAG: N-acetyl-1-D-myo-inositol-2-amino-2-deoxy-alpha-D-glucopyranoside deacetylase [Corynebacteriales bacterium]|nr:N-acetyl-1-D-myo-inositol-2-amino-2-deoxy-alpha-D-glucopyranoside deacetylase [Mycobacteriales bacterium]
MNTRRILFVHAHPDDESITTGATMARYAAAGDQVTLVTCTLGEEGEIHVPTYSQLAADQADQLGGYRIAELASACAAMGVVDHRFLGGAGHFRDSGMMGLPTNDNPRAFWQADVRAAGSMLAQIIDEVRPQVLVTYDPNGGYGHPDHIQTHRVSMAALDQAKWVVTKVYCPTVPRTIAQYGMERLANSAENPFAEAETIDELPFVVPDGQVSARIDAREFLAAKRAALAAHATQIPANSWLNVWADNFGADAAEYFVLMRGYLGPAGTEERPKWTEDLESDLFAGI